jgi:molecular chaperone DnaK
VLFRSAIQAGVIAGEVTDILLLDVTPLSLGVETLGSILTKIIDRNTTIPCKRSQVFTTAADFQTTVTVHVLQGERPMANDNISLGMFNLVGIPPAPRGVPQIEVTFDIDTNGILNVTAKDLGTQKEQKITITASTKLSKDEKERLIKESERYGEEDKKKREAAEIQNTADSMIYTAEKTKSELSDKVPKEQMDRVDKAVQELKDALSSKDNTRIKAKTDELTKVLQEVGSYVYQQQAAQKQSTQTEQQPGDKPQGEKVVDADYKVVDEEKR